VGNQINPEIVREMLLSDSRALKASEAFMETSSLLVVLKED
jgi:hypothetical protein